MMQFNKLTMGSVCAALLLLAFSFTVQARLGDLDHIFGNNGGGTTFSSLNAVITANMALQTPAASCVAPPSGLVA